MTEYVEPYVYNTHCHVDFIESIVATPPKFPEWDCRDIILDYIPDPVIITDGSFNPTIEIWVGIFFVLLAGLLGILIVSLMANKIDLLINPVCIIVQRRYDYVVQRNRLQSMNGHP